MSLVYIAAVAALNSSSYEAYKFESLGAKLSVLRPNTNEEVDHLGGAKNFAAITAVRHITAHKFLSELRDNVCDSLEELLTTGKVTVGEVKDDKGVVTRPEEVIFTIDEFGAFSDDEKKAAARKVEATRAQKPDEKPEDVPVKWAETPETYVKRVKALKLITDEQFQKLADAVLAFTPFDMKSQTRSGGPKKLAKCYYDAADSILNDADDQRAFRAAAKFKADYGFEVKINEETGRPDRQSLAEGVKVHEDKKPKIGSDIG